MSTPAPARSLTPRRGGCLVSCGASEAAVAALEPVDVVTGWFDDGIVEGGKNKLVPSVSMKLRNKSGEPIRSIQINAIFRRVGEQEMWGEYFGWAVPRDAAGRRRQHQHAGDAIDARLHRRAAAHADAAEPASSSTRRSRSILKQGSQVWAKLAEYPIQRQLLTRRRIAP